MDIKLLQEKSWGDDRAPVVCFTSSNDHSPALPVVKYLEVWFSMLSPALWLFVGGELVQYQLFLRGKTK